MVSLRILFASAALTAGLAAPEVGAQGTSPLPPGVPSVITGGSGDVSVGGMAAARQGDRTDGASAIAEGSSNVFINGKPAVTVGDRTGCGGVTVGGASNVFINGKPVARAGDLTTGCGN